MGLLILIGIVLLIGAICAVAAFVSDRPVRQADKAIRIENKALKADNFDLRALVNRLDGMAQIEYDVSDNLFAQCVRQEILKNRKEIA